MAAAWHPFGFLGGPDPSRELRRLQDEMDRLMGALAPAARGAGAAAGGFPAVNVYAGPDGIALVAELPGVGKDDLEVQAHQDTLTLRGDRRPAAEGPEAYHRRERRSGSFTRSIQLPYRIDLLDNEVESLRTFDVDTQRSIYKVKDVRLLPARGATADA